MYVRLPSMSQCIILFAALETKTPSTSHITRGMPKHAQPFNNAFIQTRNPFPESTRVKKAEKKKEKTIQRIEFPQSGKLPPSSFAETALPLSTARND